MKSSPSDYYKYDRTLWASLPLENNATIVGNKIVSSEIVLSGGNSGGPFYFKSITVQNGQVIKSVNLLGIASGISANTNSFTSYFYRNTGLIVNIVSAVV